jgi:peptidoglycan/xylan/chitin deacetylase (PgdA/CDA1 family)
MGRIIVRPETYITTSWDDGHPLDLRVAELLQKYALPGTFYVPMTAATEMMTAAQLQELALGFEIGAHTIHHNLLTRATEQQAAREIIDSKSWVESNTGSPCLMFCAPAGRYRSPHLKMIREAGYLGLRTVELISLDFPRWKAGILLMPTTIQAHPHGFLTFVRNAAKRTAFRNLWRLVVHGHSAEWPILAQSLLLDALKFGGVFHLWGHSWEVQETGRWQRLEELFRFMRWFVAQATPLTNGQICQRCLSQVASVGEATRFEAAPTGLRRT